MIEHREHKTAFDLLSCGLQAGEVEGVLPFQNLHRNVAVCLDAGLRQVFLLAQQIVVPQDAVVRERKGLAADAAGNGWLFWLNYLLPCVVIWVCLIMTLTPGGTCSAAYGRASAA